MDIKGKKLLILGGNAATAPLVTAAKNLGVYTYVADKVPGNTAKRYADRAVDIDAMDIDSLAAFVKKEGIEGVTIGTSELLLPYYADLCEKLGMPCFGTKKQFEILSNKVNFKNACRQFGVQVTPEFEINDDNIETEGRNLPFPVIVKPEDGNSTRGITICYNYDELKDAVKYAKESCLSQKYFIEKYFDVSKDSNGVDFYYFVVNGEAKLTIAFEGHTLYGKEELSGLDESIISGKVKPGSMSIAPSRFTELILEKVHPHIQDLVTGLGIKNGPIFFQSMIQDDEVYLYESGYRLNGAIEYLYTKELYGVSAADMLVNFALTGDVTNNCKVDAINPCLKDTVVSICLYGEDGDIAAIEGVEDVLKNVPEVFNVHYARKVGDHLYNTYGTYQQIVIIFCLRISSLKGLCEAVEYIYDNVKIINPDGKNMVFKNINGKLAAKYFNENRFYPMEYDQ